MDFDHSWQKIRRSELKAFELLYRKLYGSLCFYSFQITRDHDLSEEIVQDIFFKIWQEREIIQIKSSFTSYIFQAVRNQSINELKHINTHKNSINKLVSDDLWKYIIENVEADDFIIENIISEETSGIIIEAMEILPSQCRQVFRMSRFDCKSNEEIAAGLGLSVNTVRSHIYNALVKISDYMRKDD